MIVADTNLIAYLLIGGPFTELAKQSLRRYPDWIAPPLWKHEFLNVIATSIRHGHIDESQGILVLAESHRFVRAVDHQTPDVALKLSVATKIASYDCEFVTLARQIAIRLVTADKALTKTFPDTAIDLADFAAGK